MGVFEEQKIIDHIKFFQEKIDALKMPELFNAYEKAICYVKLECRKIFMCNTNLLYRTSENKCDIFRNVCFFDDISDIDREKHYRNIKKYLLAREKECHYKNKMLAIDDNMKKFPIQPPNVGSGYPIPKVMIEFLYKLCEGSIQKLKNFAVLTYKLLYDNNDVFFVSILASEDNQDSLWDYFSVLFTYTCKNTNFSELSHMYSHWKLLINSYNRTHPAYIIRNDRPTRLEPDVSFFKKFFNGQKFKFKSPFFNDYMVLKNTIPTIYFTDKKEDYLVVDNLYRPVGLKVDVHDLPRIPNDGRVIDWIQKDFAFLGANLLSDKKITTKITDEGHKNIVKNFIEKYCIFNDDSETPKKKLHNAYENYFVKNYDCESLKQGKFCKFISELYCDKVEVIRPHEGKKIPYYHKFKGIELNEKFTEDFPCDLVVKQTKSKEEEFVDALNEMLCKYYITRNDETC